MVSTILTIAGVTIVEADACVSRSTEVTAEATQWPIEDRSTISDHVIVQPLTMTLELVFSRHPLVPVQGQQSGDTRPQQAFAALQQALQTRADVTVTTPDGVTTALVLTGVSSPQTAADGYSRSVSVRATQIVKVTSQESSVPVRRRAAALKTQSAAQDLGSLLGRVAVAAEVARAVVTGIPNQAALEASASLAARVNGSLAAHTRTEVGRLLGIPASLVGF